MVYNMFKICLVKSSSYSAFIMFVFLIQIACYVRCSLPDSQVFCHVDWFCYIWFKSVPTRAISSCSCVQAWQHLKTSIFSVALWVDIFSSMFRNRVPMFRIDLVFRSNRYVYLVACWCHSAIRSSWDGFVKSLLVMPFGYVSLTNCPTILAFLTPFYFFSTTGGGAVVREVPGLTSTDY